MEAELKHIQALLKRFDSEAQIRLCTRVGSRVYGTHRPNSDHDFGLVIAGRHARRDLLKGRDINIVLFSEGAFQESLDKHNIFALEILFAPAEHRLVECGPPFPYRANRQKLQAAAEAKAAEDEAKGRRLQETQPERAKKSFFHAARIRNFADQIIELGRIVDFSATKACTSPQWSRSED